MTLIAHVFSPKCLFENNKKGILLFVFTVVYAGFICLGGVLFMSIERRQESNDRTSISAMKNAVIAKYPGTTGEAIDELLQQLSSIGVKGIVTGNVTTKWTLGNSILFSATLLTTVGYGHLSPVSQFGKIVCMFYTAIGIPLTLIIMAAYVDRLVHMSEFYKESLFHRLGSHLKPVAVRLIHVSTAMMFILTGCFLLPAWIFTLLEENWSYLDSIYFCFISLTTVGLGDFVPGLNLQHPHADLYRLFGTVYIIVGVTVMMFMMALAGDFYHNYDKCYHETLPLMENSGKRVNYEKLQSYGTVVVEVSTDKK